MKRSPLQEILYFGKYVRPYRLFYVFTLSAMLIHTVLGLIQPIYYKSLVDDVFNAANPREHVREFLTIVTILFLIRVATTVFGMITTVLNTKVTTAAVNTLEFDILKKLHFLPMKYHDRHAPGEIFPRLYNDPPVLINFFIIFLPQMISALIRAIIVFFVILSNLWWAGFVAILPAIPMWLISRFNVRYFKRLSDLQFEKHQALYIRVLDMLHGMKIVKVFNKSVSEMERFRTIQKEMRDLQIQASYRSAWMSPLLGNVGRLGGAIVFIAGAARLLQLIQFGDTEFTLGTLFMVLSYVWQLAGPLTNFANFSGEYGNIRAASSRIINLLDEQESHLDITLPKQIATGNLVDFQDVSFSYDSDKKTLDRLTFSIKRGEKIGLVGPSGSGKTTILNLICGFYSPNSGELLLNGYPPRSAVAHAKETPLLSLAMQNGELFQGTIRENLAYGRTGVTEKDIIEALDLVEATPFTLTLPKGLDTLVGEGSRILSSGQMQRLALARALVAQADILILDEATSWIDLWSEQRIFNRILQKLKNHTIICISHRLHLMQLMDRVMVLRDGKLTREGTHDDLLKSDDFYASSWDLKDFDGFDEAYQKGTVL